MEKFVIIDGNSLINRAYYGLPPLTTLKGEPINAVFGFCNILVKLIRENNIKYFAVAFDFGKKTFRHKLFDEYKGTRKATPEDLKSQFPLLKKVLKAMKICYLEFDGIEADDIIGTLSKKFNEDIKIVSGDKDVLQLIDKNVEVWFTKRGISDIESVNESNIQNKFGVLPKQVIDLKSLQGDSSDNIPGVLGIGEKTALNLIKDFGSVDNVYENIESISGKLKEKLLDGKDMAYLSKELATIKCDVEIDKQLKDFEYEFPFDSEVYNLFLEFDFKSLINRKEIFITQNINEDSNLKSDSSVKVIKTQNDLLKTIENINKVDKISVYIDKNVYLCISKYEEIVIKIKENLLDDGLNLEEVLNELKPIFEGKISKILFDKKQTYYFLKQLCINLKNVEFDVSLAQYLLSGSKKSEPNLESMCKKYKYDFSKPALFLFIIKEQFDDELKQFDMLKLYYEVEFPLVDVLISMEESGFKIDMQTLVKLKAEYEIAINKIVKEIWAMAGEEFNINSPKQLSEVLFEKLKLTKNKKLSTGIEFLDTLTDEHPIINKIIQYRKLYKIKSTYIDSFLQKVDERTHLIHTMFNQTLTSTGRLSSSEPNLQNIPIRDDDGRMLRKIFVSSFENGKIISADYSQIELRLMAHYSEDKNLIDAYKRNLDIHTKTASDIFGVPINEVSNDLRRNAKAVNFGIIYGISSFGLSKNVGCSRKEAKQFIDKYFETYPGVKLFMNNSIEKAKKLGFVSTLLNRRRNIDELNSSNAILRQFGERAAMNMPLQGSASDIIKLAMIKVYNALKNEKLKSKLILQVHDELIIDCENDEVEKVKTILKDCMEDVIELKVPLKVEIEVGNNWFEA